MKALLIYILFLSSFSFSKEQKTLSIAEKEKQMETAFLRKKGFLPIVSQILSVDPFHLRTLHLLSVYHLNRNQFGLTRIIAERILEKHPKNASAHYHLGVVAIKEKNKDEAILSFRKSLRYDSSYFPAMVNLSSLYLEYAQFEKARPLLERAYLSVKKNSSYKKYYYWVASNYAVSLIWSKMPKKADSVYRHLAKQPNVKSSVLIDYARMVIDSFGHLRKASEILDIATLKAKSRADKNRIRQLRRVIKKKRVKK